MKKTKSKLAAEPVIPRDLMAAAEAAVDAEHRKWRRDEEESRARRIEALKQEFPEIGGYVEGQSITLAGYKLTMTHGYLRSEEHGMQIDRVKELFYLKKRAENPNQFGVRANTVCDEPCDIQAPVETPKPTFWQKLKNLF